MDNLNVPAYPVALPDGQKYSGHSNIDGFTKLEKAALMIAQGMLASGKWKAEEFHQKVYQDASPTSSQYAVMAAKAVLEEANK